MLVIGQMPQGAVAPVVMDCLQSRLAVLVEALGADGGGVPFDELLPLVENNPDFEPDLVIYMGGTLVSKRIKAYLRRLDVPMIEVNRDGEVHDTFGHMSMVLKCSEAQALQSMAALFRGEPATPFARRWNEALGTIKRHFDDLRPDFSQMLAVKLALQSVRESGLPFILHFANSQPVRLANLFARQHVRCNRGVNGIEGTTSAAAGCAAVIGDRVLCVTGDLSFFYDQNALWNSNLHGNLRILLLNNGGGAIFQQLKGLEQSPACPRLVAATHHATAEGICHQNDIYYQLVTQSADLPSALDLLLHADLSRPMVLEALFQP